MDVWLFLDPAKEDIEKASDEIDQGEIGGMDMDGFPGTGGDEPTDGPQSPEDGEQVETAVQMTKDAGGLNHATRDSWDPMKHPRGPGGLFKQVDGTGDEGNKKQSLNKTSNNANIQQGVKAPGGLKKIYREELVGCSLKGMGRLKAVSDHSCDQIYRRGGSLDDLKKAMAFGERSVDVVHGGYIYSYNGIKACVTDNGILKTIISKGSGAFKNSLYDKIVEAANGREISEIFKK